MSGITPLRLASLPGAFDHDQFIFELKYDGFRALADVDATGARLISRRGNAYKSFDRLRAGIGQALDGRRAILDGEIVHFGPNGKPQFYELLRRRDPQHYCAFDLLSLDGMDLREKPLIERKRILKDLIPPQPCPVLYVDHFECCGTRLFDQCCKLDLEGIVAKFKDGPYAMDGPFSVGREKTCWAKIRNPDYSQWEGRHELFRKRSVSSF